MITYSAYLTCTVCLIVIVCLLINFLYPFKIPSPTWKRRPPFLLSPSYGCTVYSRNILFDIVYIESRGTIKNKDLYELLSIHGERERILKDINEVLVMVKNDDYDGLCRLSRSNPYI